MRVTRLRVYPVKSLAGTDVSSASVNPWGLDQDRRWGIVDESGAIVTARELNALLRLTARALEDSVLHISDRDGAEISVDMRDGGDTIAVDLSRQAQAIAARGDVNQWLTRRLDKAVRLVWQPDPSARSIAADHGGEAGDVVSMADAAPLLLISESSVRQLDAWTDAQTDALDAVRFRPNVVIDGMEAFAEEDWHGVTIGDVKFRVTMICDRCVMTTIDPTTLARAKEPIRVLAEHRRRDRKTWFGIRLTPLSPGHVSVGDTVDFSLAG